MMAQNNIIEQQFSFYSYISDTVEKMLLEKYNSFKVARSTLSTCISKTFKLLVK